MFVFNLGSAMYWWVSYGDELLLAYGTCNRSGRKTEIDALKCAEEAISRGGRAIGIKCPNGEVWDEEMIKSKLSAFPNI